MTFACVQISLDAQGAAAQVITVAADSVRKSLVTRVTFVRFVYAKLRLLDDTRRIMRQLISKLTHVDLIHEQNLVRHGPRSVVCEDSTVLHNRRTFFVFVIASFFLHLSNRFLCVSVFLCFLGF